jgi:hypothetical protein
VRDFCFYKSIPVKFCGNIFISAENNALMSSAVQLDFVGCGLARHACKQAIDHVILIITGSRSFIFRAARVRKPETGPVKSDVIKVGGKGISITSCSQEHE